MTQGPLENTVNDFWQMVWERDTYTIVNLTQLIEYGKVGRRKSIIDILKSLVHRKCAINIGQRLKLTTVHTKSKLIAKVLLIPTS